MYPERIVKRYYENIEHPRIHNQYIVTVVNPSLDTVQAMPRNNEGFLTLPHKNVMFYRPQTMALGKKNDNDDEKCATQNIMQSFHVILVCIKTRNSTTKF